MRQLHRVHVSVAAPSRRRAPRAVVAALFFIGLIAAGAVVYVKTDKGTIKIETGDEDVQVLVEKGGEVVKVLDKKTGTEAEFASGEYKLRLGEASKNVKLDMGTVRVTRGDTVVATVTRVKGEDAPPDPLPQLPGVDAEWVKAVAALPRERQVEAVAAKLKELNPGFDGVLVPRWEGQTVTQLKLVSDNVADLSPLRALPGLKVLNCSASAAGKTKLMDLRPLKGLDLEELYCNFAPIVDLSPLSGMPLQVLSCQHTRVRDLSPLKGAPLRVLACHDSPIHDLTALHELPLNELGITNTAVGDLTPLRGMPLERLLLDYQGPRDAAVLRTVYTLRNINEQPALDFWKKNDPAHAAFLQWIEDTSKLTGKEQMEAVVAKLRERNPKYRGIHFFHVTAKGRIDRTTISIEPVKDLAPLRALTSLHELTLEIYQAKQPSPFSDLSPLIGLPLRQLRCPDTSVEDLTPVRGMALQGLDCSRTRVRDLSALKGMPLKSLRCESIPGTDLSPLKGLPLVEVWCDLKTPEAIAVLASIKSLEKINDKPAAEVLKEAGQKP